MITKTHQFFLLNPSSFPLVSSFMSFNFFFSVLLFFKYSLIFSLVLSIMGLSVCSFNWWVNYMTEFSSGMETMSLTSGVKSSMILFITSEILFFFSFFWGYFHFFLAPSLDLGLSFPPMGLEMFDFTNVPLINTVILLSSGVTVTMAHYYLSSSKLYEFTIFMLCTVILGLFFSYLQGMEYKSSFFSISDGTFGSIFFMLTGFHGIHVLVGTIFLFFVMIKSLSFNNLSSNSVSFELSVWYWHFVDVVWVFLYFSIYFLNS